jgi:cysteine desulfurase
MPVQPNGIIDMDLLKQIITPQTSLVSIMAINNEIGVRQPVEDIGKCLGDVRKFKDAAADFIQPWEFLIAGALCRERKVFFHTDAAQAVGKLPMNVNEMNIDLMSISGHKIYGPKGVGALYARRRPRVRIEPIFSGGGQERGIRSGTVPTPIVVGFGAACRIAQEEMSVSRFFNRRDIKKTCSIKV